MVKCMNEKPNHREAQDEALKLLKLYNYEKPPIYPETIARDFGIRIFLAALDSNIAGYYDFQEKIIYINQDDSPQRQRFTIAHELGHYVLHSEWVKTSDYKQLRREVTTDTKELEANTFAAHLLVPKAMLNKYRQFAMKNELMEVFGVSGECIGKRLDFEEKYAR